MPWLAQQLPSPPNSTPFFTKCVFKLVASAFVVLLCLLALAFAQTVINFFVHECMSSNSLYMNYKKHVCAKAPGRKSLHVDSNQSLLFRPLCYGLNNFYVL